MPSSGSDIYLKYTFVAIPDNYREILGIVLYGNDIIYNLQNNVYNKKGYCYNKYNDNCGYAVVVRHTKKENGSSKMKRKKSQRTNSTFGFLLTHKPKLKKPKELFFSQRSDEIR